MNHKTHICTHITCKSYKHKFVKYLKQKYNILNQKQILLSFNRQKKYIYISEVAKYDDSSMFHYNYVPQKIKTLFLAFLPFSFLLSLLSLLLGAHSLFSFLFHPPRSSIILSPIGKAKQPFN